MQVLNIYSKKKNVYNLSTNFVIGQFYNSISGKFRMDFPPRNINGTRIQSPFYIDISATKHRWDYFQITSKWFIDSESPSKILQDEMHFQSNFGRPIKNRSLLYMGFAYGQTADYYFHSNLVTRGDEPDETILDYSSVHCTYEHSTLNYREFPNKGQFFKVKARYVTGLESYTPGTTTGLSNPRNYQTGHSWYNIQFNFKHFFEPSKYFSLGVSSDINLTNKGNFNNSMSTLLSAYTFNPFPQSKLVFLENFRALNFAAVGIIPIVHITQTLSLRGESYLFQPNKYIEITQYTPTFSQTFPAPSLAASLAAVYQSPIGPLALSASYFSHEETPFYFQINFGYIFFNRRGID